MRYWIMFICIVFIVNGFILAEEKEQSLSQHLPSGLKTPGEGVITIINNYSADISVSFWGQTETVSGGGGGGKVKKGDPLKVIRIPWNKWEINISAIYNSLPCSIKKTFNFCEHNPSHEWIITAELFEKGVRDEIAECPKCIKERQNPQQPSEDPTERQKHHEREPSPQQNEPQSSEEYDVLIKKAIKYSLDWFKAGKSEKDILKDIDVIIKHLVNKDVKEKVIGIYKSSKMSVDKFSEIRRLVRTNADGCGCDKCKQLVNELPDGPRVYVFNLATGEPIPNMKIRYSKKVVTRGATLGSSDFAWTNKYGVVVLPTKDEHNRDMAIPTVMAIDDSGKEPRVKGTELDLINVGGAKSTDTVLFGLFPPSMNNNPIVDTGVNTWIDVVRDSGYNQVADKIALFLLNYHEEKSEKVKPDTIFCTNCGIKPPKDAKFCSQCGKKIQTSEQSNQPPFSSPQEATNEEVSKTISMNFAPGKSDKAEVTWPNGNVAVKSEIGHFSSGNTYGLYLTLYVFSNKGQTNFFRGANGLLVGDATSGELIFKTKELYCDDIKIIITVSDANYYGYQNGVYRSKGFAGKIEIKVIMKSK